MIDLLTATATELLVQLRERRVSSRELVDGYLDRIARLNAPWNAVVTLDAERARARADELDHARTRGEDRVPLHGLPMTIKDAYEIAGLRTVAGATEYAEHVPSRTAVAVQRLLDAGAIVLGKTNVPAYCADVQTFNEVFGVTKNPHDATRTPGGSSGGAAVAIACGFTALELGSDIGGSIRTPSGWTGVYGHKPSFGVVPPRGHVPPAPGALADFDLSVCGPMARSAADLELALSVLAGPGEVEARGYGLALPPARHAALRDFRVGVWLDTCHLLASGYDIASEAGYAATFAEFESTVGLPRLRAFHVNDSKKPLGSRVDRHEHVGEGHVGLEAFRRLVNDPRFSGVPMILETPKAEGKGTGPITVDPLDERNLDRLRALAE